MMHIRVQGQTLFVESLYFTARLERGLLPTFVARERSAAEAGILRKDHPGMKQILDWAQRARQARHDSLGNEAAPIRKGGDA